MAHIKVSTWLPRSAQHLYELMEKLDRLEIKTDDVEIDENLEFKIIDPKLGHVQACFTPYGVFSFTMETEDERVDEEKILEYKKHARKLFLNDIFKQIQKISYKQINEGIVSNSYYAVIYEAEQTHEDYETIESEGIEIRYSKGGRYSTESSLYIKGGLDESTLAIGDLCSYTTLSSSYLKDVVAKFDKTFREMVDMEEKIVETDFRSLKETLLQIEKIKKKSVESFGKIKQAQKSLKHAMKYHEEHCRRQRYKSTTEKINLKGEFERISYDYDYIMPLWNEVLIKTLENLDFNVNTRLGFQRSIEAQKEEMEMKLLQGLFLVGVIASIITLGAMPGATLKLYSPEGTLLANGTLVSFQVQDLIAFGVIAIIVSVGIFMVFNYIYVQISKRIYEK